MNMKLSVRAIAALCLLYNLNSVLVADEGSVTAKVSAGNAQTASGETIVVFPGVKEITSDTRGYVTYAVPVPRRASEKEIAAQMQKIAAFCESQYLKTGKFAAHDTKFQRVLSAHERVNGTMFVWNIAVPLKDGKLNLAEIRKEGIAFWKVQDYENKYKD